MMRNIKAVRIFEKPAGGWRVLSFDKGGAAIVLDVDTYEQAVATAHMIGRYKLGLGDLLFTYVDGLRPEDAGP